MAQGASLFRLLNIVVGKRAGSHLLNDTVRRRKQVISHIGFVYFCLLLAVLIVLGGILLFVQIKSWNSGILGIFVM